MNQFMRFRGMVWLAAGIIFVTTLMVAMGGDLRLNTITHLGGLVVYCVDTNRQASDDWRSGGLQVMYYNEGRTREVLFVSSAVIERFGISPSANTSLGTWNGPSGSVTLYRLTSSEFQLNGYDEYGKPFSFTWSECVAEGMSAQAPNGGTNSTFPPNLPPGATNTPTPVPPTQWVPTATMTLPPEETPPL
ncbi:MAG: hypothetical protein K8L97_31635 [Anaerolineae bacterium]|nr:hypothetical protein [Anaerolineae bacterium]